MNENMTIDMEKGQDNGQITYANEVIATIVNVATTEVDGISGIVGSNSTISGVFGKGKSSRSNVRGVRVDMKGENVNVDISVNVDYGMPIQKVGRNVQENVRKSIESMTGLSVEKVDLHVVGVSFEKENQEMQLSQNVAMSVEDAEEERAGEETASEQPVENAPVELVEDDDLDDEDEELDEETEEE
ncbi:MAG: Asp23/Gls24 family envelope stress response protein [Clostridia bacterium]|nr:Asp23/Gls24 family envelope stress response protein [Clostridia bacterium]